MFSGVVNIEWTSLSFFWTRSWGTWWFWRKFWNRKPPPDRSPVGNSLMGGWRNSGGLFSSVKFFSAKFLQRTEARIAFIFQDGEYAVPIIVVIEFFVVWQIKESISQQALILGDVRVLVTVHTLLKRNLEPPWSPRMQSDWQSEVRCQHGFLRYLETAVYIIAMPFFGIPLLRKAEVEVNIKGDFHE